MKYLAIILLLTGCVSSGVKVEDSKLEAFSKGKTNYSEVISQLGQPTHVSSINGQKYVSYSYVSAQPRPESFIPLIGLAVGGVDSESSFVMMTFDKNDILQNLTTSKSGSGTGSGFEAYSQPRKSNQPNIVR